jgi:cytochrome c biogenesis protein CcdA
LAGLALYALAVADSRSAFSAFLIAAFTVAVVMVILVTAVGLTQDKLIRSMKGSTRSAKRWGGAILILVGVWLIALAVWASHFARIFPV